MKRILILLLVAMVALPVFAADVTTTQSVETAGRNLYMTYKSAWTATTGVDSALCLAKGGRTFEIGDLMSDNRQLSAQLETAEATASSVDKIFVWFVSNHENPVTTIASGPAFIADWTEAKRDTFANTRCPTSYFDCNTYSAAKVCLLVYETAGNSAVAENVKVYLPLRRSQSDRD